MCLYVHVQCVYTNKHRGIDTEILNIVLMLQLTENEAGLRVHQHRCACYSRSINKLGTDAQ